MTRDPDSSSRPSPNRLLFDAALMVLTAESVEDAVRLALSAASQVVPFDLGGLYWYQPEAGSLRVAVSVGTERLSPELADWEVPVEGSIAGRVVASGKAVLTNNAHLDPGSVYPAGAKPSTEHLICLPISVDGKLAAVTIIGRAGQEGFTEEEFELLQLFAGYLSVALQNARSMERVRRAGRLNDSLLRVGQRLAAAGQASEVLQAVVDEAVGLLNSSLGVITTWDEVRERLVVAARYMEKGPEPGAVLGLERSLSGRAARSRATVIANDYQREINSLSIPGGEALTAMISVPLLHEGRLLGTLAVGSAQLKVSYGRRESQVLELLAETAAAALVGVERSHLEGMQLAIRSAQHEVNNQLALAIGYAEMLSVSDRLPADLQEMASESLRGAQGAADALEKLRKVTQVAFVELGAPGGPVVDVHQGRGRPT